MATGADDWKQRFRNPNSNPLLESMGRRDQGPRSIDLNEPTDLMKASSEGDINTLMQMSGQKTAEALRRQRERDALQQQQQRANTHETPW